MKKYLQRTEPIYEVGDLLLRIIQDDNWFDHVIILNIEREEERNTENVYELYTSEGYITRRTVDWVQDNYRREDEVTKDRTEMD